MTRTRLSKIALRPGSRRHFADSTRLFHSEKTCDADPNSGSDIALLS